MPVPLDDAYDVCWPDANDVGLGHPLYVNMADHFSFYLFYIVDWYFFT
jgi:hypothetical protein